MSPVSPSWFSSFPWIIHNQGDLHKLKRRCYRLWYPNLCASSNCFRWILLQHSGQENEASPSQLVKLVSCCDRLTGLSATQATFKKLHRTYALSATLEFPVLIEAISVQSFLSSTWSTQGVCWSQNTRTGWFRYLPPNTCNDLFFFFIFPSQSHHLYHQFNIRVLVLNPINRYEVQTTYSIEQEKKFYTLQNSS